MGTGLAAASEESDSNSSCTTIVHAPSVDEPEQILRFGSCSRWMCPVQSAD